MEQRDLDFPCSSTFRELPPGQRHTETKSTLPKPGRIPGEQDFPLMHAVALGLLGEKP